VVSEPNYPMNDDLLPDFDADVDDDGFVMDDDGDEAVIPLSVQVSETTALHILQHGDMETEYGILRWSSNYAFLIAVTDNSMKLNAVYKPQRGERPLWDFPDGTLCYRERAAYLTSRELGWQIVPPTVLRDGPRGLGSVQMFIEHDPQINFFSYNESPGALKPQLMRIAVFDALINNADRKGGHCLLDPNGHVWGIDHGISFHSAHKLRTVIWDYAGDAIPDALISDIDRLCSALDDSDSAYRQELCNLLSQLEIKAFQARVRQVLKSRRYPQPGSSGPNYPWPPV